MKTGSEDDLFDVFVVILMMRMETSNNSSNAPPRLCLDRRSGIEHKLL
jgi:hypothetical protein